MKTHKMYEAHDKMISLIRDNRNVLQSLGSFGIKLGFGEKTVEETCEYNNVDTYTFLAVVNFTMNGYDNYDNDERISIPTLLHYLKASHVYFLDFQLPLMSRGLQDSVNFNDDLGRLIMKCYDEYASEVRNHMLYEEKTLFPYVEALLEGKLNPGYDIETFSKHHDQADLKIKEVKDIIIKYLPSDVQSNHNMTATLYNICNNEEWLRLHSSVEDHIFVPAIRRKENELKKAAANESAGSIPAIFLNHNENTEVLSEREKDVIRSLVSGKSNKEIAEDLFISVHTVITHRRNIARKLQIHSSAGLTIYAIVNGLVDIQSIRS